MRITRTLAIAVIALAACGPPAAQQSQQVEQQTSPSNKPGDAPPPASAPQSSGKPDDAPAQQTNAVTPQFLVGRWGDNGDCTKDIIFNADGTFRSYTGGGGNWRIDGDTLTMTGASGTGTLHMQRLNDNQLLLGNPDGSTGISQRC